MLFPLKACPAWIPNRHCEEALLRGSDVIPAFAGMTYRTFFDPRWQCRINHGMIEKLNIFKKYENNKKITNYYFTLISSKF
ncbi:hypothetical protein [Rickettsia sp. wq]|uniref:hypothetical protein n=1 Tax=Rickettsia sp. wq TaxID=1851203 RepID=UPI00117BD4D6|nr:hypothetical protein [Rickettsia sp. wq]